MTNKFNKKIYCIATKTDFYYTALFTNQTTMFTLMI